MNISLSFPYVSVWISAHRRWKPWITPEMGFTGSALSWNSSIRGALAWRKWNPGDLCSTFAKCFLCEMHGVWICESSDSADPSENPHFCLESSSVLIIHTDWIRNQIKAFVLPGRNISSIRRGLVPSLEELLGYYGDGGLQSSFLCSCKMGFKRSVKFFAPQFSVIPLWHIFWIHFKAEKSFIFFINSRLTHWATFRISDLSPKQQRKFLVFTVGVWMDPSGHIKWETSMILNVLPLFHHESDFKQKSWQLCVI